MAKAQQDSDLYEVVLIYSGVTTLTTPRSTKPRDAAGSLSCS